MNRQLDIEYDSVVHLHENNIESQEHLDNNRHKFNQKCKIVFGWLISGRRIKVLEAAIEGVSSLPRRIKDLKDKGVLISDEWAGDVKEWFMDKDQIEFNKNEFNYKD